MANSSFLKSSIAKKVAMALSGLFLISFLSLHFFINLTSVFSEDVFNMMSHFMGYNPIIQFVMQPILVAGVVFHFVMGFVLEIQNRAARPVSYAKNNGAANSSWASRNMIISGLVVLAFLGLHFYDFWIPEIQNASAVKTIILNRWGDVVFESNELNPVWIADKDRGLYYVEDGVYVYRVEVQFFTMDAKIYVGHIVVTR